MKVQGIEFVPGPRVLLRPSFAMRLSEVKERVQGGALVDEARYSWMVRTFDWRR